MKIVNRKATEGSWIKYDKDKSVELLIRPLSIYDFDRLPTEETEITVNEFGAFLQKILTEWKGIFDETGEPLECNDENKKLISDHDQELAGFIINTAVKLKELIVTDKEIKN